MARFASDSVVAVRAFTRQIEDEEVIIGRPDISVYLALPLPALDLLEWLGEGRTCGEAAVLYGQKHGEVPDVEDFLAVLEKKGFITTGETADEISPRVEVDTLRSSRILDFDRIPQSFAQVLFGKTALGVYLAITAVGTALAVTHPWLLPRLDGFVFRHHMSLISLGLLCYALTSSFVHELAHVLAARAVGVSSRMAISHRLWILVAETDLSGLWSVPKSKRFVPILAGVIADLVEASLLLIFLFAAVDVLAAHPTVFRIFQALLLVTLLRVVWQFYFYLQTDFYYVIIAALGCRNLMGDSEVFLRNQVSRFWPRLGRVDQENVPEREMRVVRVFSVFWVLGRVYSLGVLVLITVPTLWWYLIVVTDPILHRHITSIADLLDKFLLACVMFVPFGTGLILWIKGLLKRRRWNHAIDVVSS